MATFTYAPDWGASPELEPRVRSVQFGDGYEQRATNGLNPILPTWKLQFTKRTQTEAQAIYSWMVANNAQVTAFDWAAPGEGVAAGELSGTGDGTRVTYSLVALSRPCTVVGTPAIYRTDWQGTYQLSSTARTNRLPRSQDLSTGWSATAITLSAATTAPDGTTSLQAIVEDATTGIHALTSTGAAITTATSYRISAFFKAREMTKVFLNCANVGLPSTAIAIDLVAGTAVSAHGSPTDIEIRHIGGGVYWAAFRVVSIGGAGSVVFYTTTDGVWANRSHAGTAGNGVYAWGAMISAEGGSYIPTVATAVTVTDYSINSAGLVTLASTTNPAVGQALGNGTGAQVAFPITVPNASTPTVLAVYVNGVKKTLTTDYTVSGSTITFVVAPALGLLVTVDYTYVGGLGVGNTLTWTGSYTRKHVAKFGVPKPDGFNSWSITADFREVPL